MASKNRDDSLSFPDFNFSPTQGKSSLKLHLGCGTKRLPDFIHIDGRAEVEPDIVSDVAYLPMFADNSVELIYFCHGLEHIRPYQVTETLAEWKRVLKPNGILRLSLPDFTALANLYIHHKIPLQSIAGVIHGGQDYPENLHYWSWDFPSLSQILAQIGFVNIRTYNPNQVNPQGYEDFSTHTIANWNISLNLEATKPILIETSPQSPEGKYQPYIQTDPIQNSTPKGFSNQPAEKKKKTRSNKSKAKNKPISGQFQGVSSLFAEAMRLHQQQQYEQALALYQQVLSQQPDHVEALGNLASLLRRQGQLDEAIATYRRVLELEPNRPEIWFNLGNILQAQDNLIEAETAFQQAIALQPNLAPAHFNLGKLLQTQERWEEAAASYRQAIAHQPDVARFYCNLGNVLKALGQLDQAIVNYRQAIALEPNSIGAYYNLGNAFRSQGRYRAAITAYQQVLQLDPDYIDAQNNLAELLEVLKQAPEASQKPQVTMSSLGKNGRFGNQIFQYAFLKIYANLYDLEVETPAWIGQELFECDEPPISQLFCPVYQQYNNLETGLIEPKVQPYVDSDFWGYFQYHTRFYAPHKNKFCQLFQPKSSIKAVVDTALNRLQSEGKTCVGIHLRRGDYRYQHPTNRVFLAPSAWYLQWLQEIWPTLDDPILFLASDELEAMLDDFRTYNPITINDLGITLSEAKFYLDFYLLSHCDIVAISNSTFSFATCLLNDRGSAFYRPDPSVQQLVPFEPWNSEPLLENCEPIQPNSTRFNSPQPPQRSRVLMNTVQPKDLLSGRVLIAHHWPFGMQRNPIFSQNEIFLTIHDERHPKVLRIPAGVDFDIKEFLSRELPGWEPDIFISWIDSFFNVIPRNLEALSCPKVLMLGDTQHGYQPLNRVIQYAQQESYDFYVSNHIRHHLWYFGLAGIKSLYWLPVSLFLKPPLIPFEKLPAAEQQHLKTQFQSKAVFLGSANEKFHPRRVNLLKNHLAHLDEFFWVKTPQGQSITQPDTLKAYAAAQIALNISLNGDMNLRTFEILSAQGFLLMDKLGNESGIDLLLEAGLDYETFANAEELVEKVKYFCQHPQLTTPYRQRSYARYCQEYTPQHMIARLSQLLQGAEIENRFTTQSIDRIQYCQDTEFSWTRISLYETVQELHRKQEYLSIWLDARVGCTSAADFLDLPRLDLTITHFDPAYVDRLQRYLVQSGNQERVTFVDSVQNYHGFNVIITSEFNPAFLAKVCDAGITIISDDQRGKTSVSQYDEFQTILATQETIADEFFKVVTQLNVTPSSLRMSNQNQERKQGFGQNVPKSKKQHQAKKKSRKQLAVQDVSSLLTEAMRLHQQQQYEQALFLYQQVLSRQPDHVEALGNLASLLRRQGQLDEAIATYRRVLELEPNRPEIWFNLGNTLQAQADLREAEKAFQQAIALQPDFAAAHFNLGKLLQTQERWENAAASYRQAIAHQPDVARFYCNLGNVLKALGQLDEAVVNHQQAIALDPNYAEAYYNLGNVYKAQDQYPEARTAYQQALQLQPQFAQAWLNLAGIYQELGNLSEAETAMRQAITQQPDFQEAYLCLAALLQRRGETESVISLLQTATQQQPDNEDILTQLAIALQKQNRIPEVISAFEDFLASHPDSANIHNNLGSVYTDLGQYNEAITHLKQAINLQPDLATAHTNLGFALIQISRLGEAIEHCQEAILIAPQLGAGYLNLGYALNNQGRVLEGIANFQSVLEIEPDSNSASPERSRRASSNLLYALNYESDPNREAIAKAHFDWGKRLKTQLKPTQNITPKKQRKSTRLRIGYLSPDFRQHSVAYFIEPILYHHDKTEFEIFCYANVSKPDLVTERLSELAEHWCDIYRLDDQQVCEQIQADEIDILVDLAGHTGQNRLPVFANKPAAIQVTYIGYPNTTGLETIDYRLTDAIADPPGMNDSYYTEELIRLPNCFLCYQPPADLPAVNPLPAKTIGRITFGSFNNLPKLTPQVIDLWSRILQAVPNSRLILKVRWFDDASTRDRYINLFVENGIDPKRIKLFGKIDDANHHLAFYGNIDIALDPFPYNGTTTTCEALLMGVPTLTLTGFAHVNRVGQSLLTTVGLSEWVAETPEEYLNKAVTFAEDWEALGQLRSQLRQQILNSSLCAAAAHTSSLENIYYQFLKAWRNSRLS